MTTATTTLIPMTTEPVVISADRIKEMVTGAGSLFFTPSTMRVWGTRTAQRGWMVPCGELTDGRFEPAVNTGGGHLVLVTSDATWDGGRAWTVRHFVVTDYGRKVVREHTPFQVWESATSARKAAEKLAQKLADTKSYAVDSFDAASDRRGTLSR